MGSQREDVEIFDVFSLVSHHATPGSAVQVGVQVDVVSFLLISAGNEPHDHNVLHYNQSKCLKPLIPGQI